MKKEHRQKYYNHTFLSYCGPYFTQIAQILFAMEFLFFYKIFDFVENLFYYI